MIAAPANRQNRPLLTANKAELIQRIHAVYDPIQSFNVRADMSASVGNLFGGEVKDYATISGVLLYRKPNEIRILGQDPLIHSTIFDMVSTGNEFRLSIPSRNRFIEGTNSSRGVSSNKLENLRPAAFLTSLLIFPPDPASDLTILEDDTDPTKSVYIVLIARREGDQVVLLRNVYFDRHTLQIDRQKTFDPAGETLSETKYSGWKDYRGIPFASSIDIQRPQDGYEVTLNVQNVTFNSPGLTAARFILDQPAGADVQQFK